MAGACRYCGLPPGPVCDSYECNEQEQREQIEQEQED